MPAFLSLFAGIGGFDEGLRRAGWDCVGQVELDAFCQRVLVARFPGVERVGDVRAVGTDRGQWAGDSGERSADPRHLRHCDLLVGGFPCQDLSVAGKRAGLGGERSGLFYEIVRIAKITRPTWGLFENVPGLLSSHRGRDFWLVLQGLRECWPAVGWRVLDSQHFGVAQRRRRVFLVCGPTEAGVAEVLALAEGGGGDLAAGDKAGADAASRPRVGIDLARALGGIGGGQDYGANKGTLVAHALSAGAGGSKFGSGRDGQDDFELAAPLSAGSNLNSNIAGRHHEDDYNLVVGPLGGGNDGIGRRSEDDPNLIATEPFTLASRGRGDTHQLEFRQDGLANALLRPSGGRAGIGVGAVAITHARAEGHDASEDGTGRGPALIAFRKAQKAHGPEDCERWEEDEMTDTLAGHGATTAEMIQGPSAVRRLTPVECERLQAFPDGWTCLCQPLAAYADDPDAAALACRCSDSARYRALGNAVTVNVVHELGARLLKALAP